MILTVNLAPTVNTVTKQLQKNALNVRHVKKECIVRPLLIVLRVQNVPSVVVASSWMKHPLPLPNAKCAQLAKRQSKVSALKSNH